MWTTTIDDGFCHQLLLQMVDYQSVMTTRDDP